MVAKFYEPISVLRNLPNIPKAALWLGFLGLTPFFVGAGVSVASSSSLNEAALQALLAYGAVILSFLGGVRWGLVIASTDPAAMLGPLFVSTVPALLGWVALLVPVSTGLMMLALSFAAMLVADLRFSIAPNWYRLLRLPLSAGAIFALLTGLLI